MSMLTAMLTHHAAYACHDESFFAWCQLYSATDILQYSTHIECVSLYWRSLMLSLFWFAGVRFSRQYNLPGATMLLSNATVVIQNSVFSQLSWHGQAALVVQNSDVTLFNTTFAFNNNSNGTPCRRAALIDEPAKLRSINTRHVNRDMKLWR